EAVNHYQQALALARETGDPYPETEALIGLAGADVGEQALALGQQALYTARVAGHRMLEGHAPAGLADTRRALHRPDQAVHHAEQALAIHRETGYRLGLARTLITLGHALRQAGGADGAHRVEALWREALALFTDIGTGQSDEVRALLR